jgi:transposase-like protein
MPRVCRVCGDPRREEIDRSLASRKSVPAVARETGIPESNIYRHRKDHMTIARSITSSRPAATLATVERLEMLDQQLKEVLAISMRKGHTNAAVAAINQRIRVAVEISGLRDEIRPKESRVLHVHLDKEQAERIARSYMRHEELTGEANEKQGK